MEVRVLVHGRPSHSFLARMSPQHQHQHQQVRGTARRRASSPEPKLLTEGKYLPTRGCSGERLNVKASKRNCDFSGKGRNNGVLIFRSASVFFSRAASGERVNVHTGVDAGADQDHSDKAGEAQRSEDVLALASSSYSPPSSNGGAASSNVASKGGEAAGFSPDHSVLSTSSGEEEPLGGVSKNSQDLRPLLGLVQEELQQQLEEGFQLLQKEASVDEQGSVFAEVQTRLRRLEVLVLLRRLYRDVVRSNYVLSMPRPRIDRKDDESKGGQAVEEQSQSRRQMRRPGRRAGVRIRDQMLQSGWMNGGQRSRGSDGSAAAEGGEVVVMSSAAELLEYTQDIRELSVALQRDLDGFRGQLGLIFPDEESAVSAIEKSVRTLTESLESLADEVEGALPLEERAALLQAQKTSEEGITIQPQTQVNRLWALEALPKTSAVLDKVRQRIASVDLSRVDLNIIQRTGQSLVLALRDLWRRLNGLSGPSLREVVAVGLPIPSSILAFEEEKKLALILEVEALDRRLRETSRSREARLREKNVLARTRLASEIRAMDDEVNVLRRELAVRTLQLEMEVIYMSLEAELLLLTSGTEDVRTDQEESLLIAEFGILDAELARLRLLMDQREAIIIRDEDLELLATDIPELKSRLGIEEEPSIPLQQRLSLTVADSVSKLRDGGAFYLRGMRLLGADITYSLRLFWAAFTGTTLKPREVSTLRRTAKDVLALIPFSIILIAPITPVGHVMVFGFLQRYFPGFFPSAFSTRRQEVMKRYETLKEQMALGLQESKGSDSSNAAAEEKTKPSAVATIIDILEAELEDEEEQSNAGDSKLKGAFPLSGSSSRRASPLQRMATLRLRQREPESVGEKTEDESVQ